MTAAAANPLHRLALRTSYRQCAPHIRNSFISMIHDPSVSLNFRLPSLLIVANNRQRRKCPPLKRSRKHQTLFNIHTPSQDHRDRG